MSRKRPTEEQKEELLENRAHYVNQAAQAIKNADYLLLSIGAGFSADSGLATFQTIAQVPVYQKKNHSYVYLCNPDHFLTNPQLAYGFWGKTVNDYKTTKPHFGHEVILKWKNQFFQEAPGDKDKKFFIYSSNIDEQPQMAGFDENEIYEIHGSSKIWQCVNGYECPSESAKKNRLWRVPEEYKFDIDEETLLAEENEFIFSENAEKTQENNELQEKIKQAFASNHPKCIHCGGLARPAVLMFGDRYWVSDTKGRRNYRNWESNM